MRAIYSPRCNGMVRVRMSTSMSNEISQVKVEGCILYGSSSLLLELACSYGFTQFYLLPDRDDIPAIIIRIIITTVSNAS